MIDLIKKYGITEKELDIILKTREARSNKTYNHMEKGRIKIGIIADTHIGEKNFDINLFEKCVKIMKKEKVDRIYHLGDIVEGMSIRAGQIYELTHIGFKAQTEYASKLLKEFSPIEIYAITGNHDDWYKKGQNMGASVGDTIESKINNFHYLGEFEADIKLHNNFNMRLFHPNDGVAYADSYKLQKLIESYEGGKKPNLVCEGHYHKALYMFRRNIHGLEGGTLCNQTRWMRGRKIQAHKGFWILDMSFDNKGISKFIPIFYPDY